MYEQAVEPVGGFAGRANDEADERLICDGWSVREHGVDALNQKKGRRKDIALRRPEWRLDLWQARRLAHDHYTAATASTCLASRLRATCSRRLIVPTGA